MNYQAIFNTPLGNLGIRCSDHSLLGIDFLPIDNSPDHSCSNFSARVREQLLEYFINPRFQFNIPLELRGTAFQVKVWNSLRSIRCGDTWRYGELARQLNSGARAIGQACASNPIPIIVPCHRVVSTNGIGGFMHHAKGNPLVIKQWLLAHEQC